jgi:hypothetical protein
VRIITIATICFILGISIGHYHQRHNRPYDYTDDACSSYGPHAVALDFCPLRATFCVDTGQVYGIEHLQLAGAHVFRSCLCGE